MFPRTSQLDERSAPGATFYLTWIKSCFVLSLDQLALGSRSTAWWLPWPWVPHCLTGTTGPGGPGVADLLTPGLQVCSCTLFCSSFPGLFWEPLGASSALPSALISLTGGEGLKNATPPPITHRVGEVGSARVTGQAARLGFLILLCFFAS